MADSEISEPEFGVALEEALQLHCKPETLQVCEDAKKSVENHTSLTREFIRDATGDVPERVKRLKAGHRRQSKNNRRQLKIATSAAFKELREKLSCNELVAWGAIGSTIAARSQIPAQSWNHLKPSSLPDSEVCSSDGIRIYDVRIYHPQSFRRLPLKTQVAAKFHNLPQESRDLLSGPRGSKRKLAKIIADQLPGENWESVERTLREFRKAEGYD